MGNWTLLPQPKPPATTTGLGRGGALGAEWISRLQTVSESLNYKNVFICLRVFSKTPKKQAADVGKIARTGGNKLKRRGPGPPSYVKIQLMMKAFEGKEGGDGWTLRTYRGNGLGERELAHEIPERKDHRASSEPGRTNSDLCDWSPINRHRLPCLRRWCRLPDRGKSRHPQNVTRGSRASPVRQVSRPESGAF